MLGTQMNCATTAEPNEMPFGGRLVGPKNHVITWGCRSPWEKARWTGTSANHCNAPMHECTAHCSPAASLQVNVPAYCMRQTNAFADIRERKGKEEYLYSAILYTVYISKRSGMNHTVLSANTPCLPFLHKHSPDCATHNSGRRHLIAAYYSSINPERMKC